MSFALGLMHPEEFCQPPTAQERVGIILDTIVRGSLTDDTIVPHLDTLGQALDRFSWKAEIAQYKGTWEAALTEMAKRLGLRLHIFPVNPATLLPKGEHGDPGERFGWVCIINGLLSYQSFFLDQNFIKGYPNTQQCDALQALMTKLQIDDQTICGVYGMFGSNGLLKAVVLATGPVAGDQTVYRYWAFARVFESLDAYCAPAIIAPPCWTVKDRIQTLLATDANDFISLSTLSVQLRLVCRSARRASEQDPQQLLEEWIHYYGYDRSLVIPLNPETCEPATPYNDPMANACVRTVVSRHCNSKERFRAWADDHGPQTQEEASFTNEFAIPRGWRAQATVVFDHQRKPLLLFLVYRYDWAFPMRMIEIWVLSSLIQALYLDY